jgi:hypothetical protein
MGRSSCVSAAAVDAAAQGQSTVYFYKANALFNTAGCGGVVALQVKRPLLTSLT